MILEKREAKDMIKFVAAFIAAYLILAGGFCLFANIAGAQADILPIEPPTLQAKNVHIMTADERSEILIYDIWKPSELDRVTIGKGAALGIVHEKNLAPAEPYGWLAFVSQDALGSWRGSAEAMAYGGL